MINFLSLATSFSISVKERCRAVTGHAWLAFLCVLTFVLPCVPIVGFTSEVHAGSAAEQGDATRGKELFQKRCGGCHFLDDDREGPRLRHIYGSKAASVPGFKYSSALSATHITWTAESLDKWLTDPETVAPDNDMAFRLPKASERADVIRFLQVTAGK